VPAGLSLRARLFTAQGRLPSDGAGTKTSNAFSGNQGQSARYVLQNQLYMKDGSFDDQLLKYLIESPTYYVIRTDMQGLYTYVNPHFQRKFSYMASDFRGMPFQETIHPGDVETCNQAAIQCISRPGQPVKLAIRKSGPTGDFYWTSWQFTGVTDPAGNTAEILCIGHDITEGVTAEIKYAKTSHKMDAILDTITDGFFVVDRNWRIIQANRAFEKLFHVRREEQVGRILWDLYPDAASRRFYAEAHQAMQEQQVVHLEEFYPAYNTWLAIAAYPSEEGLTVYFRDVTERKQQEHELRDSLYKLRAILNSSTDVNFFIDAGCTILSFNRRAGENARLLFGRELKAGQRIYEYIPAGDKGRFDALFDRALGGETVKIEYQMQYPRGGVRWIRVDFHPVRDDEDKIIGVALNIVDVNDQKQAEIQIRAQNERLLEITRVQSHELRRPVANMLGLIYLFDYENPSDEFNQTLLRSMKMTANELDNIIHRIVAMTQAL
jgi:PAS domain S-box-containing protein